MLPLLANCAGIFEKQEDRSDPLINGMIKAFVAERFAVPMHSDSFMRCLYSNNVHEMVITLLCPRDVSHMYASSRIRFTLET